MTGEATRRTDMRPGRTDMRTGKTDMRIGKTDMRTGVGPVRRASGASLPALSRRDAPAPDRAVGKAWYDRKWLFVVALLAVSCAIGYMLAGMGQQAFYDLRDAAAIGWDRLMDGVRSAAGGG